jgi:hypothetical protein
VIFTIVNLPENKSDLLGFFSNEEFIQKTFAQISKDLLGLTKSELQFKRDMNQDVLRQMMEELMTVLSKMNEQTLQQFIYKVDLKEVNFLEAITKNDGFHDLSFLVIKREAQKVFIKAHFK